jgi:hypothetical protein
MNNNNDRKRRGVSLSNTKKIRRSELTNHSKTDRSSSISNSLTKINHITQEYSLSTLKQFTDSYQKNNSDNGMFKLTGEYLKKKIDFCKIISEIIFISN